MKKMAFFMLIGLCLLALPLRAEIDLLHSFAGPTTEGSNPYGDLLLSGTTLYGMTELGGASNLGTIFKIDTISGEITLLHSFAGRPPDSPQLREFSGNSPAAVKPLGDVSDGANPYGSLIISDNILYGLTRLGGRRNYGAIFKIGVDGTGFTLLHSFGDGETKNGYPQLREFTPSVSDGAYPGGSLIISGSTLYGMTFGDCALTTAVTSAGSYDRYGMTRASGTNGKRYIGTIFSIDTAGNNYHFRQFAYDGSEGANPYGSLLISDNIVYGMTRYGGASDKGAIFKIGVDNTGFALLHSFAGGASDGAEPYGSLILSGSTLYGMTSLGGAGDKGAIFNIGIGGGEITLLHSFAGSAADGEKPHGDLLLSGSTLYGMTEIGGASNEGTIFKIGIAGTGFELLHSFAGVVPSGSPLLGEIGSFGSSASDDGARPWGSLIISGLTLYGMTEYGGDSGNGVIFSLTLPSITVPGITVTSPNGGENWQGGDSHDITWTSTGTKGNVNIDYSIDSGTSWTAVVAGTANGGSYAWTVPAAPSTTCLVRVSEVADSSPLYSSGLARGSKAVGSGPSDTSDAVFTIYVAPQIYTVTFVAGSGGTITGAKVQIVNSGSSTSAVTAVPNKGYHFVNWSGDYSGTTNPLTVTNVTSNMTITANFAINQYTVTFVAGSGGTITGAKVQIVNHGDSASAVTAVPNTGYYFVNWTGNYRGTTNPLTVTNVTDDMTSTANFANLPPTVTILTPANGATVSGTVNVQVEASDHDGIARVELTVDGQQIAAGQFPAAGFAGQAGKSQTLYQFVWNSTGYAIGQHALQAIAYDTTGLSASVTHNVTVDNAILTLQASRLQERTWTMIREYGHLVIGLSHGTAATAKYAVLRKEGGGQYAAVKEITLGELSSGSFAWNDGYLQKGVSFTYRVLALNSAGETVGASPEITI